MLINYFFSLARKMEVSIYLGEANEVTFSENSQQLDTQSDKHCLVNLELLKLKLSTIF